MGIAPAFVHHQLPLPAGRLCLYARRPNSALCIRETFQLAGAHRVGVTPLLVPALHNHACNFCHCPLDEIRGQGVAVEGCILPPLIECAQRHGQLLLKGHPYSSKSRCPTGRHVLINSDFTQKVCRKVTLVSGCAHVLAVSEKLPTKGNKPLTGLLLACAGCPERGMPAAAVFNARRRMVEANAHGPVINSLGAELLRQHCKDLKLCFSQQLLQA
mmetsp:Transcript_3432/g.9322  ORF Transcript_3432/g.9322 Transcript_3432/m.9322 type:complete len:215 (+) Transcript_3432:913-1557(+)